MVFALLAVHDPRVLASQRFGHIAAALAVKPVEVDGTVALFVDLTVMVLSPILNLLSGPRTAVAPSCRQASQPPAARGTGSPSTSRPPLSGAPCKSARRVPARRH